MKITTQMNNMLAPLRMPGVNVVYSPDGIVAAAQTVAVVLTRPAKNRAHMTAYCADERVKTEEKDFPNMTCAIDRAAQILAVDKVLRAWKGEVSQ